MKPPPGSKFPIKSSIEYDGKKFEIEYFETDSFRSLENEDVVQVYGVCFEGDKMLIVYNGVKGHWGLPGGSIENNEKYFDTLKREVLEESNYSVVAHKPVGYQEVKSKKGVIIQLRYVCRVKKNNEFTGDPSGSITKIKLIKPSEYRSYFDWGEIGDAIINRAIVIKKEL